MMRSPDLYRRVRRALRAIRWPDGSMRYSRGAYGGDQTLRRARIYAARQAVAGLHSDWIEYVAQMERRYGRGAS